MLEADRPGALEPGVPGGVGELRAEPLSGLFPDSLGEIVGRPVGSGGAEPIGVVHRYVHKCGERRGRPPGLPPGGPAGGDQSPRGEVADRGRFEGRGGT